MSRVRLRSRLAPQLAIAAVLLGILGPAAPAAVAAEGERVLEPRLSLIGGCKEETLDNVEDPGCPSTPPLGAHPPEPFSNPRAVATDEHGNIYVGSYGSFLNGSKGRVDVFCSDGTFVSELPVAGVASVAIDSEGYLYVFSSSEGKVLRYKPDLGYQPEACEISYGETAPVTVAENGAEYSGMAINKDNDHLFVNFGTPGVIEYKSAAEGNEKVRTNPGPNWGSGAGVAVDAARDRLYSSAGLSEERIDIYDLNTVVGTPPNDQYEKIGSIQPSSFPGGNPGTQLAIAVDEGNGNVFVLDGENCQLYEFEEDGTYLQTIDADFVLCTTGGQIGVDNGPTSPNGKVSEENETGRFLYVPSNRLGIGHSYAFFVSTVKAPEVLSTTAANVSEDEAELRAEIDPNNAETTYTFEYKAEGAASWTLAGEGTIAAGDSGVDVAAAATGLKPGTSYVFRVIATNEKAEGEDAVVAEASFSTYPTVPIDPHCPNALFRTGPSALLPDCRAYELVTPADTNARAPLGMGRLGGVFTTRQVSPAGDKVPFRVEGGSLPGLGGTGSLTGDPYLATRTDEGWSTAYTGPSADEASQIVAGGRSPDQEHSFYFAGDKGSAVLAANTGYVRYPDGHSELLGQGSLPEIEPEAAGKFISEGGGHIIFATGTLTTPAVQLEPNAAPDGTQALYDRTPDGTTHVVSLKPGDLPFGAGEVPIYQGTSPDGVGVVFEVNGTMYLRYDNEETFTVGSGITFAGTAEGGDRVFYMEGGDLMRFNALAPEGPERVTKFTTTGNVTPVTVSADGSTAYFVSPSVLGGTNPQGDSAQPGEENLYRSVEGQIDFLATVTERDVEGAEAANNELTDGLGLWVEAAGAGTLGRVPARSTPDGEAFLFKSRAALTDYDPEDHAQIYRYAPGELECISCNPTGAAASSDATLQSETREGLTLFSTFAWPENLRADGRRAFFETSEALVANDSDGLRDVYEWEEQGVGSCTRPQGCVYLISSPQSRREEYLWAVGPSGSDVFFLSSELLVGSDADETPSIYDARVGGGFAEETAVEDCEGEACRPNQEAAPAQPTVLTPVLGPGDQAKPRRCPKGKRKVKKAGKVRCVKKHRKKKGAKKHRAGAEKKGGRR